MAVHSGWEPVSFRSVPASGIVFERDPAADFTPDQAGEDEARYVLKAADGRYLHESLEILTVERRYAWRGTRRQRDNVLKRPLPAPVTPRRLVTL